MQAGYYSATGGMVTQFNKLDNITNNLANINTNSYKRQNGVIGDFLRLFQEERDILPLNNHTKEAAKFYNRTMARVPQIVDSYTDFTLGTLSLTGNRLDFALQDKDTFFAIKTPNGIRLTRDGAFTIDKDGKVVNKDGFEVLPNNYLEDEQSLVLSANLDIDVDKDGNIYQGGSEIGTFMVVKVDNLRDLKKEGSNLYIPKSISDLDIVDEVSIRQGFLEKSNVNAVIEMSELISTNRLVGMYQKVMDSQMNDLNRDAIEKLGYNRG